MSDESRLILMGHIAGAFGVRGEVKIRPYTAQADGLLGYGPLLDEAGAIVLTPKRGHAIKDCLAVTAPEIETREHAEALKGVKLYVRRAVLPAPADDEFYVVDLIGCAVHNLAGESLGVIFAAHDFGAGDVLEIRGGKTWFLPFTAQTTPRIDLKARLVIADPPPGLLDPAKEG
jgi:16S rRNA processing protein RimM